MTAIQLTRLILTTRKWRSCVSCLTGDHHTLRPESDHRHVLRIWLPGLLFPDDSPSASPGVPFSRAMQFLTLALCLFPYKDCRTAGTGRHDDAASP